MKLLHIIATPRAGGSNTLAVSSAFLASMQAKYPDLTIESLNLFVDNLPAVAGDNIESKYTLMYGMPIDKQHKESWEKIETEIRRFLSADMYLITTPMWNFSIPYALKYYIDTIVQPGYLFKYNELGQPVPLTLGKKLVCITSRGGDYSENSPFHAYDFQEPYLRAIFGFVGITDQHFIHAQPMDISLAVRATAQAAAIEQAVSLAQGTDWAAGQAAVGVGHSPELKPRPI